MALVFIELRLFSRQWEELGLDDDDLACLQDCILLSPGRAPVVGGTGGLRKLRFSPLSWGVGKRGALRVGYAWFAEADVVVLITVYAKNRKDDLTPAECRQIKQLLGQIGAALAGRG